MAWYKCVCGGGMRLLVLASHRTSDLCVLHCLHSNRDILPHHAAPNLPATQILNTTPTPTPHPNPTPQPHTRHPHLDLIIVQETVAVRHPHEQPEGAAVAVAGDVLKEAAAPEGAEGGDAGAGGDADEGGVGVLVGFWFGGWRVRWGVIW